MKLNWGLRCFKLNIQDIQLLMSGCLFIKLYGRILTMIAMVNLTLLIVEQAQAFMKSST